MDDSAVFCGLVCPFDDEAFIILAAAASLCTNKKKQNSPLKAKIKKCDVYSGEGLL